MGRDNTRGVLLMLAAMALFALEDMFLKWAAVGLPVGQIIFVSGAFGLPIFAVMARRTGGRTLTRAALHPAVLARNLGEMVGSLGYVTALATVPLSTVSAVLQATPLAVTMAAALFMGEHVGWRRWSAIGAGFAGVLLVIRPGIEGFRPEALWVLLTVAGIALRDLASRAIPATSSNAQVSAWGLAAVTLMGLMMMLAHGSVTVPSVPQIAILSGTVVFGSAGYWAVTAATRTGEVSAVSPFRYARLVFAILIGAFVFAEKPDAMTLAGASVIVLSGLYSFMRERALARRTLSMTVSAG